MGSKDSQSKATTCRFVFAQISPTHSVHLTTEIICPFLLVKGIGIPSTGAVVAFCTYTYVLATIVELLTKKARQVTHDATDDGMLVCMCSQQKRGKIKAQKTANIPTA